MRSFNWDRLRAVAASDSPKGLLMHGGPRTSRVVDKGTIDIHVHLLFILMRGRRGNGYCVVYAEE